MCTLIEQTLEYPFRKVSVVGLDVNGFKKKVAGGSYKGKEGALKAIHRFSQWDDSDRASARRYVNRFYNAVDAARGKSAPAPKGKATTKAATKKVAKTGRKAAKGSTPPPAKKVTKVAAKSAPEPAPRRRRRSKVDPHEERRTQLQLADEHLNVLLKAQQLIGDTEDTALQATFNESARQCLAAITEATKGVGEETPAAVPVPAKTNGKGNGKAKPKVKAKSVAKVPEADKDPVVPPLPSGDGEGLGGDYGPVGDDLSSPSGAI